MKRKSITRGGGREDENGNGETNKNHNSSSSSNDDTKTLKKKKKKHPQPPPPPPPVIGTVATRTRHPTKAIASTWNQPISILIHIMGYADPETIRMLCCVSKQFNDLIANDPGMKNNRVIPLLLIRPSEKQLEKGRGDRLLRFLYYHRTKIQLYREIKIINANKFAGSSHSGWMELPKIKDTLRLYGIVSLDMSSPPPSTYIGCTDLRYFFPSILPNLRDINLSNNGFRHTSVRKFSSNCPNLEKITWHNIDRNQSVIDINGLDMKHATNLKEIYMDSSVFSVNGVDERDELLDLEKDEHSNIFLFYQCRTKLERVSIRNAHWYVYGGVRSNEILIPQIALIKFVRNAPMSLRWFRSDLTKDNMTMLRSERPGIELVN